MKKTYRSARSAAALVVVVAGSLFAGSLLAAPLAAQTMVPMKEEAAGLLKKAKITPAAATATAMAKVPGGKVEAREIEMEDGKLIYSFDIKVTGKSGIEEVAVDALTGAVLSVEHETPADEAKEKAADKAKASKPPMAKPAMAKPATAAPAAVKPAAKPPAKH